METFITSANRGSISTGYDIDNSLKFESANTESLTKSQTASNRRTWTLSWWFKRTKVDADLQYMFHANVSSGNEFYLVINGTSDFRIDDYASGAQIRFHSGGSGESFRDSAAWYHVVIACDTTQSTEANRFKVYLNGVDLTAISGFFSTAQYPSQNYDTHINDSSSTLSIGKSISASTNFCGYMCEFNFIDGLMKEVSDFGEFDSASGIWKPKEYTGSYGNQGYFLNFADSANLGDDASGNGKNFTENNITAADQSTDTCTNNFCTLNALIPYSVQSGSPVISEGATYHNGSGNWTGMKGTIGFNKGKWYWELQTNSGSGGDLIYGVQTVAIINNQSESTATSAHNLKETAAWYVSGGHWIADETSNRDDVHHSNVSHTIGNTVVYGIGLNMDDGEVTYYANGSAITNMTALDLDGLAGETVAPFCSVYNQAVRWNLGGYTTISISSAATDANGYGTFEYAPPSGYYALCSKNLAEFG